ncbi:hypothetical protein CS8_091760 [Cupriavidus sp. 8B]
MIGCVGEAFELGEKNWKLSLGDGVHGPSRHTLMAGDLQAVLQVIAEAKARCGLTPQAPVRSCYEAGAQWLLAAPLASRARYP